MPANHSINYVELPAADIPAVQAFYSSAFGWTFTSYGPEYVAFEGTSELAGGFFASPLTSRTETGAALVVLFAEDLEATQQRVVERGGSVCREIFAFPGGRRFHFHDPHGNELAVWSDR